MITCVFIFACIQLVQTSWLPKILWTYWEDQLNQNDHKLKIFHENHIRSLNNSGWEYRFLNKETAKPWIKDMKEVVEALQRPEFKNQHVTRRSNLIRLSVIKQYGGVWIDYSTFLVNNLDWLDKLKQNSLVENINGDEPNVLMTYNSFVTPPVQAYDAETQKYLKIDLRLQSSFIAAKPKVELLNQWHKFFIQGKRITEQKLQAKQKLRGNNFIVDTIFKQKIETGTFNNAYFQFEISLLITIQRKQRQLDQYWQKNGRKGFRQFAVKYFNLWTMPFEKSTYISAFYITPYSHQNLIIYLLNRGQEQLEQNKIGTIYPIKTIRDARKVFFEYFERGASTNSSCPQLTYINKESLFYKYLLKDYPIKFTKNVLLDKYAARLNIGLNCPKVVFDEKRRIQIEYTSNGLSSQIGKVFDGVSDSYYVDIEIEDESTLNLFTKGWRRVQVRNSDKNTSALFFSRETDKFVKMILGEPNSSISPPEKTTTLVNFCKDSYDTKPKFLNIGQMGVKRMVLHTNDWKDLKCRPEVIQIKDIKNLANFHQHEVLLLKQDYVLLRDYRLNETERVSQIFVTKEKQEYYRKHYKEAHEREAKDIGVVKFSDISKIIEDYFLKYQTEKKISQKDKPLYHFSKVGYTLVISNILKDKTLNSKRPVFVFEFDPQSSEVVVSGQYNKSTVSIQYMQFLKLDIKQQGEVFIFDHNSHLMENIRIRISATQVKSQKLPIHEKRQQQESKEIQQKKKFSSKLLKNITKLIDDSLSQYDKLNQTVNILYGTILVLILLSLVLLYLNQKLKYKIKSQNQFERVPSDQKL